MAESKKKTCFVIGPIGVAGSETRKSADFLLNGIIRPAVESYLSLKVWRADEDNQPGMITDKLINDLFESDLVIADLSELNPNAFYELGIRHAAEKPTVHMAAMGTKLPFDNLGHRAIFFDRSEWRSVEAARTQLMEQCEEALGEGFQPSNPVVQALSYRAFRASPRKEDNLIADMMERLESLEARQAAPLTNGVTKFDSSDPLQAGRRKKLESVLRNYARSDLGLKLDIKDGQVRAYASLHSDEAGFRSIMDTLKAGQIERVLNDLVSEVPF